MLNASPASVKLVRRVVTRPGRLSECKITTRVGSEEISFSVREAVLCPLLAHLLGSCVHVCFPRKSLCAASHLLSVSSACRCGWAASSQRRSDTRPNKRKDLTVHRAAASSGNKRSSQKAPALLDLPGQFVSVSPWCHASRIASSWH
jgi:hypothetical protein